MLLACTHPRWHRALPGWMRAVCCLPTTPRAIIPIRIKNDNCVASPCRAAALSAASRLVLLSNANWNYFTLSDRSPFSRLIYPVPESGDKAAGLGVHLTIDLGGQAKFGPDVQWGRAGAG